MSGSAFHSDAVILAGRQGALEEVEPVLPPIRLVLVDIGWRAEDLTLDSLRRIGLELGPRRGAVRRRDQRLTVEAAFRANRRHGRRVGDVALLGPDAAQQREGELAGVAAALLGRHDGAGGEIARHRKILGMDVELDAEEIAPALELDEAIGLALLRPLADRQTARDRKDFAIVAWLVAQLGAVLAHHGVEPRHAEIAPGRYRGEEIFDDLGHFWFSRESSARRTRSFDFGAARLRSG